MPDVTHTLAAIDSGDASAAEALLPIIYDELRRLAAQRLANEPAGQTLQPTALVHEAYLRLVKDGQAVRWNGRGHFFAACAEAMRRILIENARRRHRAKHGPGRRRVDLDESALATPGPEQDFEALDEALTRFESVDPAGARLVRLRFFAGLSMPEAAEALGLPLRTAERDWAFARAWLHRVLGTQS